MRHTTNLLLVVCLMTACDGLISPLSTVQGQNGPGTIDPGKIGQVVDTAPFKCADSTKAEPAVTGVSRLSRQQFVNSLKDVVGLGLDADGVNWIFTYSDVPAPLSRLPPDGSGGKAVIYDTQDQGLNGIAASEQFEAVRALAGVLTSPNLLAGFVRKIANDDACNSDINASGCVDAFIERFGLYTLRRPLDPRDDDHSFYRAAYDLQKGYRGVIIAFLLSPGFLFQTEFKGAAVSNRDDLTQRTSYEIASKLSYSLTNSLPDPELFAAAAADFTGAGRTLDEQVTRLLKTPRAREQYRRFFTQWVRPSRVPGLSGGLLRPSLDLIYPDNFDSPLPADTDMVALRNAAIQELSDLGDYYAFGVEKGTLADVVTSDLSFSKADALSKIYGVSSWDGGTPSHFPEGQRAGLFSRAAFLFSGANLPNPIMRGARLRTEFLCANLTPPANTNTPSAVALPSMATHRDEMSLRTETKGTACAGCHTTLINPLGFAFDHYDSLGRYRQSQPVLSLADGKTMGWAPVNAKTTPRIDSSDDPVETNDAVGLSAQLAKSTQLSSCFVRHYFRFTAGRPENEQADGCELRAMNTALSDASSGSLQNLFRSVPKSPLFALRKTVQ